MMAKTDDGSCKDETQDKPEEKADENKAMWSCLYRMYNCLLALPVLSLTGAVLLLGGHFEDNGSRFMQMLEDLRSSSRFLNVTKHISEETALSHLFWLQQSEDARAELEQHVTRTNHVFLNPSQWLPRSCMASLELHRDSTTGLYQRFLTARSGAEFNEPPLKLNREEFHHFVFTLALCSQTDVSADLLRKEISSEIVYYRLLASTVLLQHLTVWHDYECRYVPENESLDQVSKLAKAEAHAIFAEFLSSGVLFWFNSSSFVIPQLSCSSASLTRLKDKLDRMMIRTMEARDVLQKDAERFLWDSNLDLFANSSFVIATVVALSIAIFIFSSTSRRSREMARDATMISSRLRTQSEKKHRALDLCLPRAVFSPAINALGYSADGDNCTVSATVLAFEMAGLGHVMQNGDCNAALWAMTHIFKLVEEKVCKHQASLLQQHGAACIVAAVSNDIHCCNWPLCSVADLALDLMTSLADVQLTLTSDGHVRPRFGIHTGQAIGFVGTGSPVRYHLVGGLVSVAMRCQKISAPNCIRLSWTTYSALSRLGHYICVESDGSGDDDCLTHQDCGPALYLAGKRTCRDENLHPVNKQHTIPWVFHYI